MSVKFPTDFAALEHLRVRMTGRKTRPSRTSIAKIMGEYGPTPRRDRMTVIFRWLRRHVGGEWYRGGHHVGRLNFGPAICEDAHGRGPLWLDRCEIAIGGAS